MPRNRGKNLLTLIASMSLCGMGEAMCIKGATEAKAFEVYVDHFLALRRSGRDNRWWCSTTSERTDRPRRIRELIEAKGAEVLFLPSYSSPDLNPIEEAFSNIKGILRKGGARTHEALTGAMAEALSAVTPREAAGWFSHSGYEVEVQYL